MNVRVLLVLAAVLVAGVVAPKRKGEEKERTPRTPGTSQRQKTSAFSLFKPLLTKREHREGIKTVTFNLYDQESKKFLGTRTCKNIALTNTYPYGKLLITTTNSGNSERSALTLLLDPERVRFRHLEGSSGLHDAERTCSPYVGNNENLFTWKDAPRWESTETASPRRTKETAMNAARLCTQEGVAGRGIRRMLKLGKPGSNELSRNHHAAHVEIQIRIEHQEQVGWATVPGAWVFPTSAQANQQQDIGVWHNLRTDLTDVNIVTAIQLPFASKQASWKPWQTKNFAKYQKEQMKLYISEERLKNLRLKYSFETFYPSYRNKMTYHLEDIKPWQQFAFDSKFTAKSGVMLWSVLSKLYGRISDFVKQGSLIFEVQDECQFITGRNKAATFNNKELIKQIQPPFSWFPLERWHRHKNGVVRVCRAALNRLAESKAKKVKGK